MTDQKFIPNSFQVPNAYIDDFWHLLTGDECKILMFAARRIFGFRKTADRITNNRFAEGSPGYDHGCGLNEKTVRKVLNDLKRFNLIIESAPSDPSAKLGAEYSLQTDYEKINLQALLDRRDHTKKINKQRSEKALDPERTPTVARQPYRRTVSVELAMPSDNQEPLPCDGRYQNPEETKRDIAHMCATHLQTELSDSDSIASDIQPQAPNNSTAQGALSDALKISTNGNGKHKSKRAEAQERATTIPRPFKPGDLDPNFLEWLKENAPDIDWILETKMLVNNALQRRARYINWLAFWRNWMLRAQKAAPPKPPKSKFPGMEITNRF